jgi:hypothetical protein
MTPMNVAGAGGTPTEESAFGGMLRHGAHPDDSMSATGVGNDRL